MKKASFLPRKHQQWSARKRKNLRNGCFRIRCCDPEVLWKGAFLITEKELSCKNIPTNISNGVQFCIAAERKAVTLQKLHSISILIDISDNIQNSSSVKNLWISASIGLSNAQYGKEKDQHTPPYLY